VDDASHELRTPIAVIQGYVNMLDRWGKDDPKVMEESITAIKDETVHMKTLIDQLLFLARGDMERHVIHKMPLDANELLEEVAEESRMIDASHEYLFETDGIPHPIHADPAMIKQVLRILTDNASKYTPSGGTVKFRAYEKNARVCMEVSDTGIGISTDELPRIFDRFYRGQNLRGESSGGSGLGLSIAKWIVDEHSGEISAISSEGIGTRMTVSLDIYTG
jgi:signal transduction histidine kinase